MATIKEAELANGKKVFRVRVRKYKKIVCGTFSTRIKAERWARRMETRLEDGQYFPVNEAHRRTVAEAIERYVQQVGPRKPKTFKKQVHQIDWWNERLGTLCLAEVAPLQIGELRDELSLTKAAGTVNRYLAILSHVFSVAIQEWGWAQTNPASKVKRLREPRGKQRFLTKEEIRRLLEASRQVRSKALHTIVTLAICTGSRKSEILSLKWEDVDFLQRRVIFRDTKNGDTRACFMVDEVFACLEDEFARRRLDCGWVFPNQKGTGPVNIETAWKKILKIAQLDDCGFHTLRHTCASHMAASGASLRQMSEVLGHKTLAMVKRYSHLAEDTTGPTLVNMTRRLFEDQNDQEQKAQRPSVGA